MEYDIKKNTIWNIIGTTINAFVSLFLLIIVTRINGTECAGLFSFAFSVSLVFNVIGVYYGRVYQASDHSDISDYDYFISKLITCIIMMVVSVLFVFINDYDTNKLFIVLLLCVYKCIEAYIESLYAVLQKNNQLYKVGISLSAKGILSIIVFLIVDSITSQMLLAIMSIIIIHCLIIVIYDIFNLKKAKVVKTISFNNIKYLLKDGFYPFLITFLTLYIINSSKYAIDLSLDDTSQAVFGIIIMPATVILMFAQYILHPYIVKISDSFENGDYTQLKKIIRMFRSLILICGLFSVLAAFLFGIPVLQLIYGIDLMDYRVLLVLIMIGATLYGVVSIFFNILIIMRKNKLQSIILLMVSVLAFVLSYVLTNNYNITGAVLSYLIIMILLFIIYEFLIVFLLRKGVRNE